MATTATITPTLGSAPVTLQAGNYSAIDDRRFWGSGVREGVLSGGSYQVTQRAAGANMTVDVASSVGDGAVVTGDSVTAQGRYMVPPTAANVNVDIAAADATNPRNDLVVLEVKDDQHDAGGLNIARVRVITGTPNASAAATDAPGANGTPALPSSCLLLAHVRVTAGATSVTTAMINDRRPWAWTTPTYETSLPSPGVDGQEIYYRADSTNSVIWHLRYRNVFNSGNATYPWEYVGGGALVSRVNANVTATSSTAAAKTGGPSFTLPLAGLYRIGYGAMAAAGGAGYARVVPFYNGSALPGHPTDSAEVGQTVSTGYIGVGAELTDTLTTGAQTLEIYYATDTGTANFIRRWLRAVPVRVG